ncbi:MULTISPECIES: tyrosine-type recombinase/integrase [Nocardiopsis]|uniref:tyrosine-type recombinase/integrase n=1 Tax=Nocardiopsis TaxID=2013 RepID=UPI000989932A
MRWLPVLQSLDPGQTWPRSGRLRSGRGHDEEHLRPCCAGVEPPTVRPGQRRRSDWDGPEAGQVHHGWSVGRLARTPVAIPGSPEEVGSELLGTSPAERQAARRGPPAPTGSLPGPGRSEHGGQRRGPAPLAPRPAARARWEWSAVDAHRAGLHRSWDKRVSRHTPRERVLHLSDETGLPPIRFHGLRHRAASLTSAAGADMRIISETLGHSSPAFTADVHTNAMPYNDRQAAEAVFTLLGREPAWTPMGSSARWTRTSCPRTKPSARVTVPVRPQETHPSAWTVHGAVERSRQITTVMAMMILRWRPSVGALRSAHGPGCCSPPCAVSRRPDLGSGWPVAAFALHTSGISCSVTAPCPPQ